MSAYVVIDIDIHDPEGFEQYKQQAAPTVAAFGGRYLARGGRTEVLEGSWNPPRLVILEFADIERAKAWLESEEYRPVRQIRHRTAKTNMVVVEGMP